MIENIRIVDGLPFVTVKVSHKNKSIMVERVLVDTGSGSTIFKVDLLEEIGIKPEDEDIVVFISGVGGSECVYLKTIDSIQIGELRLDEFTIDLGIMDYGLEINGIIGMDYLSRIYSCIDLERNIITGHP